MEKTWKGEQNDLKRERKKRLSLAKLHSTTGVWQDETMAAFRMWHVQNSCKPGLTTSTSTHKLTNLYTYRLVNSQAYQLINSLTYELINSRTDELVNLLAYKLASFPAYKLVSLPTHKLTNWWIHQLKNSSTQNRNYWFYFTKRLYFSLCSSEKIGYKVGKQPQFLAFHAFGFVYFWENDLHFAPFCFSSLVANS